MNKAVITVVGKDSVGIIAKTCTYLSENNVNILDISQTIVHGYFNMMMIVDLSAAAKGFSEIESSLSEIGKEMGVVVHTQKEEIFEMMHRIGRGDGDDKLIRSQRNKLDDRASATRRQNHNHGHKPA